MDLSVTVTKTYTHLAGSATIIFIVIACLPMSQTGTIPAAVVTTHMQRNFRSIQVCLLVGIAGGVPRADADIRLGDVVVGSGGVVQYDFGKSTSDGFVRTSLNHRPANSLLQASSHLKALHLRGMGKFHEYVSHFNTLPEFTSRNAGRDILFDAKYHHVAKGFTCEQCDKEREIKRQARDEHVMVYYGIIASGNLVMKYSVARDRVSSELNGALCFEMEAAGLITDSSFPCLVIRGISDYADSHKNDRWKPYAAATAASYAKDLLLTLPSSEQSRTVQLQKELETSYIPLKESSQFFTGRGYFIDRLKNFFALKTTRRRDFVLYGLGGCGKTQICLRFAEENKDM